MTYILSKKDLQNIININKNNKENEIKNFIIDPNNLQNINLRKSLENLINNTDDPLNYIKKLFITIYIKLVLLNIEIVF